MWGLPDKQDFCSLRFSVVTLFLSWPKNSSFLVRPRTPWWSMWSPEVGGDNAVSLRSGTGDLGGNRWSEAELGQHCRGRKKESLLVEKKSVPFLCARVLLGNQWVAGS